MAQEESRSISANTTWGIRKQFADGKLRMATKYFLGYDKSEDGKLIVNKKQAETVKLIFKLFLLGYTPYKIAKELNKLKIKSPMGKDTWHVHTIQSMLINEKYMGDALLQKHYTVDFLTKKQVKNKGEVPQYYVTDDHEPIIDKKTFDVIQVEMKKRNANYSANDFFTNKIVCGECGSSFGRRIWHSNDKYRKIVYRCNHKYKNEKVCSTGFVVEDEIKELFVNEFNKINKNDHIKNISFVIDTLCDTITEKAELEKLIKEKEKVVEKDNKLMELNSTTADDYTKEHEKLTKEFEKIQSKIDAIESSIVAKDDKRAEIEMYRQELDKAPKKITEFDNILFAMLVDKIVIYKDRKEVVWKGTMEN